MIYLVAPAEMRKHRNARHDLSKLLSSFSMFRCRGEAIRLASSFAPYWANGKKSLNESLSDAIPVWVEERIMQPEVLYTTLRSMAKKLLDDQEVMNSSFELCKTTPHRRRFERSATKIRRAPARAFLTI
mmetsp:Transcript_21682/g.61754  ORF Transcript_21682/g.61754 Transcript_21682/m.61754 type:complete len:129 (-) Transcript_21682:802-1188(-)